MINRFINVELVIKFQLLECPHKSSDFFLLGGILYETSCRICA